jgi:hypothetical protein
MKIGKIDSEKTMRKLLRVDGRAIAFASQKLLRKREGIGFELAKLAVQQNGFAMECITIHMLDHHGDSVKRTLLLKELLRIAVQQNGMALAVSPVPGHGAEITKLAVEQNGMALEFAESDKKDDKEIVMAAVKEDGRALQFASERLRDDAEIVGLAVTENIEAIRYVSPRLLGTFVFRPAFVVSMSSQEQEIKEEEK